MPDADDAPRFPPLLHSLGWMACFLLAGDAVAMVGLEVITREPGTAEAAREAAPNAPAKGPRDEGWWVCQLEHGGRAVTPVSVAITYLDTGRDRDVTAGEVAGWFGDLDRSTVDVWKLETVQGERRVAFELSRARWPRWDQVTTGLEGKDACSAVRGELLAHRVGRPRPPGATAAGDDDVTRSRHDFELIYARRPSLYRRIEWAGPLDALLGEVEFALLQRWLETGRDP